MEPKFQSTFIPKNPIASSIPVSMGQRARSERTLLGFISKLIFSGAVLLALGAVAFGLYLNYSISNMAAALEAGRAALEPETVNELIRLNDRIVSTGGLIERHSLLSPLFKLLEASTLKSVRFTNFSYAMTVDGLELSLKGEARSYSALAQQADILQRSRDLDKLVFSNLTLDEKGNVVFSLKGLVDPTLLSYERAVENIKIAPVSASTATTTATTTPKAATSSSKTIQ